jgi:hypothetical protein
VSEPKKSGNLLRFRRGALSNYQPSWRALFEQEVAARNRLNRLTIDGSRPDGKILRSWWKSVQELLRAYAIAVARGTPPEPPPAELAQILSGLAGYLAIGQLPGPIDDARREGRRSPGPDELSDIGWAVVYRQASRPEGINHNGETIRVLDATPVKTLARLFKVDPNTVRGWVRHYPQAFCGVNNINADVIIKHTEQAGRRYANCGRGNESVRRCSRKG